MSSDQPEDKSYQVEQLSENEHSSGSSSEESLSSSSENTVVKSAPSHSDSEYDSASESDSEMSRNLIGNIEPFVPGGNFVAYENRVEQFFLVNKVGDTEKTPLFITICGAEIYELLTKLTIPHLPSEKTFKELTKILTDYFRPKRNIRAERYKFNRAVQEDGESIADFIVRLKVLSQTCEFGAFIKTDNATNVAALQQLLLNELLLDRFIIGITNEKIQQTLLNDKEKTFEDACEKAIQMELVQKEQKEMKNLSVNAVRGNVHNTHKDEKKLSHQKSQSQSTSQSQSQQSSSRAHSHNSQRSQQNQHKQNGQHRNQKQCRRCARHHQENSCPAVDWECFSCGKIGHTSQVCRAKNIIKVISTISSPQGACIVNVDVNKQSIQMEVDTGACTTIISKDEFQEKFREVQLNESNQNLITFSGQKIRENGAFLARVEYRGVTMELEMTVVDIGKRFKAIIGRSWLDKLFPDWRGMYESNTLSIKTVDQNNLFTIVKTKFPNIVNQELSDTITGFEVDLVLKPEKTPVFHAAYTVPFKLRDKVDVELKRLCHEKILEPIKYSQWASPIVIAAKSNGEIRVCLDGKASLNKCLEFAHYPLPLIEDIFAEFANCRYFSVIDLKGAYQQLKLSEQSRKLLVINTQNGLYAYKRLTFGVNCAASIFQSVMDQILQGMKYVRAFQDDIIIGGLTIKDATENVMSVCERLSQSNVKINIDKCKFLQKSVNYLGHCLTDEGIKPNNMKVRAILDAPAPQNVQQLQSFLGLINYYRKFIPNMSSELNVLYNLLNKGVQFKWSIECKHVFEKCKTLIVNNNILEIYDPKKEIIISTDASPYGVGAVMSHIINGEEKPIMFISSTLSPAEKNYSQVHREGLAIMFAVKKFHKYLYGQPFTIYTDSSVIKEIFSPNSTNSAVAAARLQRWAVHLSMYEYQIKHRSANKMTHADALSRLPLPNEFTEIKNVSINFLNVTNELPLDLKQISDSLKQDKILSQVYQYALEGWPKIVDEKYDIYFRKRNCLSTEDNCLFYYSRVVIPDKNKNLILRSLHESHMGVVRMKMLARSYVWWYKCDLDIENYVKNCDVCQQTQTPRRIRTQSSWQETKYPFERIHIDFFDFAGKKFLLVVDAHTKFCDIKIMNSTIAEIVIKKLLEIFEVFGFPKQLVSDNGPPFQSFKFNQFCKLNGIEILKSPPYHPESNGLAERAVKTVKTVFKKYCLSTERALSMEQRIHKFLLYYRNTPTTVNGRTPSSLMFAFKPRIVLDLLKKKNSKDIKFKPREKSQANFEKIPLYKVGEEVLYLNHFKDIVKWIPAKIEKVLSSLRYLINVNNYIRYVHVNQIKRRNNSEQFYINEGIVTFEKKQNDSSNETEGLTAVQSDNELPIAIRKEKRTVRPTDRYQSENFRDKRSI